MIHVEDRPRAGASRGQLLRSLLGASAGGLVATALVGLDTPAQAAPSPAQDKRIARFLLQLEDVKAAYYTQAVRRGGLKPALEPFARAAAKHEHEHAAALRKALGSAAPAPPSFTFGTALAPARFPKTAILLEEEAIRAYNGQAANVTHALLGAALAIVSVEGRHAAWIRDVVGVPPAPVAADPTETALEVTRKLRAAHLLP